MHPDVGYGNLTYEAVVTRICREATAKPGIRRLFEMNQAWNGDGTNNHSMAVGCPY
jgi:hypothetical protein